MLFYADDTCDPSVQSCDDGSDSTSTAYTSTPNPSGAVSPYITVDDVAAMDAVIAKAVASANEAQQLANSPSAFWTNLVGSETAVAALQSDATAGAKLAGNLMAAKVKIMVDPNATEADVQRITGIPSGAFSNAAAAQTVDQLSATTAAKQVAADTAADISNGISAVGAAGAAVGKIGLYVAIGGAALLAVLLVGGRK
jgi:hypothetical protein